MRYNFGYEVKPWYMQLSCLGLAIFYIVYVLNPGVFGLVPILTIGLFCLAIWCKINDRHIRIPQCWWYYFLWGVWAVGFGMLIIPNFMRGFEAIKMVLRQILVIWSCAVLLRARKGDNTYFYWIVVFCTAVQAIFSAMGYHVEKIAPGVNEVVNDVADFERKRAEGLTGNANSMGFVMLSGVWACVMLWQAIKGLKISHLLRIALIGCIVVFVLNIIQTASRKSLLNCAILLGAWLCWLLPGRFSAKSFLLMVLMGILAAVIGFVLVEYVMTDTYAGRRFQELFDAGGGSATEGFKENIRYWLYVDGFKMWLDHPICGVGIGQFGIRHWSGLYSHSDYMEPLATTGLVGFILYHGAAFSILCHLLRLMAKRLPGHDFYIVKGMILFLVMHYFVGFGGPWYSDAAHFMVLTFIEIEAMKIERNVI